MLCRNCNYILSGEEDFCPHCGQALKSQASDEKNAIIKDIPLTAGKEAESAYASSIFESEPEVPDENTSTNQKKSSRSAKSLVALFAVILIAIAGFAAAEYFNLTPAIASFIASVSENNAVNDNNTNTSNLSTDVPADTGLVAPEINYKPAIFTVTSKKALPLRKGPSDNYAQLDSAGQSTQLQVIGGCLSNDNWVYVYIPAKDIYGWLNASYLSADSALESTTLLPPKEEPESTSPSTEEKSENTESQHTISQNSYPAKVTAEKGLYLRVGPGTDFEALKVIGRNEKITVLEVCLSNPQWLYVECGGEKGYVNGNYVSKI